MTRTEMQLAFFGYVALFDRELRTARWIEENINTVINIFEDGWNVRAAWRGDMVHVNMEINPDECTRADSLDGPMLTDQPPIKLLIWLNVNGTWANVPDVSLGYCLFEPPKFDHFIVNFVHPIVAAVNDNLKSLAAAQDDLRALCKSVHV